MADAPTDTPETDIYSSLPTGNYGGAEFKILNNISNFAYTSMDLESETGDVLDDAVYQRTRSVGDRLGVKISVTDLGWDEALDTGPGFCAGDVHRQRDNNHRKPKNAGV